MYRYFIPVWGPLELLEFDEEEKKDEFTFPFIGFFERAKICKRLEKFVNLKNSDTFVQIQVEFKEKDNYRVDEDVAVYLLLNDFRFSHNIEAAELLIVRHHNYWNRNPLKRRFRFTVLARKRLFSLRESAFRCIKRNKLQIQNVLPPHVHRRLIRGVAEFY